MDPVLDCTGEVSPETLRTLQHLVDDGVVGSAVYKDVTGSTSSDAIGELQSDHVPPPSYYPRLFLADIQSAGRGRQGNTWMSDRDALTFSLVVPMDLSEASASFLAPAVGVAIARAIEFTCAPCRIGLKWPNDLCVVSIDSAAGGSGLRQPEPGNPFLRKLGGILIESVASVQRRCVIGIGLNVSDSPKLDTVRGMQPAALQDIAGRTIARQELLAAVIESLVETLAEDLAESKGLVDQYRQRCVLSGKNLSLNHGGQIFQGYCNGITDDGALELIIDGKSRLFRSGEVQGVRPV